MIKKKRFLKREVIWYPIQLFELAEERFGQFVSLNIVQKTYICKRQILNIPFGTGVSNIDLQTISRSVQIMEIF